MFGILYTLFGLGAAGAGKIKQSIDDENARERSRQKGDPTYYGKNGETLVSNNKPVWTKTNNKGDKVIVDLYTGKEYINLTKEKEDKKKEEARKQGKTVLFVPNDKTIRKMHNDWSNIWAKCGIYPDLKDINTGKYYYVVHINGIGFYMEIETGHIIRVTDEENFKYKRGNISVDKIIEIFNKNQEELKHNDDYGKMFSNVMNKFYCKYRFVDVNDDLTVTYEN